MILNEMERGVMVTDYERQARLFKTLMHPARLAILDVLRQDEACVCHLEAVLGQRQAYISQQLMVLREAALIEDRRDGWNVFYRIADPTVFNVIDAARSAVAGDRPSHPAVPDGCDCPKCVVAAA
jgi:DNA-binding transcriptional ArsR family regulator